LQIFSMRDAKGVKTTASVGTSIDVATLFGSGSNNVVNTSQIPAAPTSVSLDQLFGRATLNDQTSVSTPPLGKPVDLAALFQAANPPAISARTPPKPTALSINDLFTNAMHQKMPTPPQNVALSINDLFNMGMQQPNQPSAPVQPEISVPNPSLALLNQLRGNPVKEPVIEQVPPNPANTLLDILKGAKPISPQQQQQTIRAPPSQVHMQPPVQHEQQQRPTHSPSVQQRSPIIHHQQTLAVNGSNNQQTHPLIALLQGASVNQPETGNVASPRNKVASPHLNQRASPQRPYTSPKATPSKSTLLDTLLGATPAKQLPQPAQQQQVSPLSQKSTPPYPLHQRRSISGAPPLLPQQAQELTSPRLLDRIKSPAVLSKPEFIQQYLNLIQVR
jgi:hypothetical protein